MLEYKIVTKGVIMELDEYLEYVKPEQVIKANSSAHQLMHKLSQDALKITCEINNMYHSPEELAELFSKLTGKKHRMALLCFRLFTLTAERIFILVKMYL